MFFGVTKNVILDNNTDIRCFVNKAGVQDSEQDVNIAFTQKFYTVLNTSYELIGV